MSTENKCVASTHCTQNGHKAFQNSGLAMQVQLGVAGRPLLVQVEKSVNDQWAAMGTPGTGQYSPALWLHGHADHSSCQTAQTGHLNM